MYKISIANAGIENFLIAQYCVKASSYQEAGKIALEISGTKHTIKILDLAYLSS